MERAPGRIRQTRGWVPSQPLIRALVLFAAPRFVLVPPVPHLRETQILEPQPVHHRQLCIVLVINDALIERGVSACVVLVLGHPPRREAQVHRGSQRVLLRNAEPGVLGFYQAALAVAVPGRRLQLLARAPRASMPGML